MFKQNKYTIWYYRIIDNARKQERNKHKDYFERHHIIPKSIGGINSKENLVILTPREHYVCHILLIKMTEGKNKAKMFYALTAMAMKSKTHSDRYHSRLYEYHRKNYAKYIKGVYSPIFGTKKPDGFAVGSRNSMFGRTHTDEVKQSHSKKMKSYYANGMINPMLGASRPDLSERNRSPKRWVTDGQTDKLVHIADADQYLSDGFKIGRSYSKI